MKENKIIRFLTLYQPYATLLAYAIKGNETRPGATSHTFEKGTYLIHAAQKWTKELNDLCKTEPFYSELKKLYPFDEDLKGNYATVLGNDSLDILLPLGQIVGSFEVGKCMKVVGFGIGTKSSIPFHIIEDGDLEEIEIQQGSNEDVFGDYSENRSIWIGQNHRVLKEPIPHKGGQGYYQKFKGDVNQLKYK